MSQFTEFTSIAPSWRKRITTQELKWELWAIGSGEFITVPKWFEFDGATVPMIFGALIQRVEPNTINAACIHDRLYVYKDQYNFTRRQADLIFREACIACWTPKLKAHVMYIWIRLWGWLYWDRFI